VCFRSFVWRSLTAPRRAASSPLTKRIAIYARCSTADDQTTENQISELHAAAERHSWFVAAMVDDQGVSGGLDRKRRPAMKALLWAVMRRKVDMVAAWAVDRLGLSLVDLLGFLGEPHTKQAELARGQSGRL
jgi:DNA invertase Pin-like site-specific DNA recombinase